MKSDLQLVVSLLLAMLVCGLVDKQEAQAQAINAQAIKPVATSPDYNGSYNGSPYTGSARFTTLYRDNQDDGVTSGCRGEGCGRHPGVDIAVPSGTEVHAPLTGTVVISRCDNSWGGLVVIRSNHPERPWESIFQVFGHLRVRAFTNGLPISYGDYIQAGTIIGRSGGAASDICHGNSTGSHLHYQIDKDDGNPEPYFPASGTLNNRDDNATVLSKTYNPLVLLQGGYNWKFAQDGNRELWDLNNFRSWGVSGGALWMDGDFDPYIRRAGLTNCGLAKPCSSSFALEASDYKQVYLDIYNACPSTYGKVYFTTIAEPYFDENKVLYYYPSMSGKNTGPFNGYIHADWNYKWSGVITGLRVDPSEQCSYGFDPTYYGEISLVR